MAEDINAPPKKLDLRFDEWLFRFWAKYQGVQVLANLLSSLGNGIIAKTGMGAFSARTVTGTTNQITVTNGDGVSGNPTISLPSAITTPGSLTTTTDLTVNGNTNIGNASTDILQVNSSSTFTLSGNGEFSITGESNNSSPIKFDPITSGTAIGFLQGVLTPTNLTPQIYQFLPEISGSSPITTVSGTAIRLDSTSALTGATTNAITLDIISPVWSGATPTNWRQVSISNVAVPATNVYGIYSNITPGTNKWNFYGVSLADNFFNGRVGIGTTTLSSINFSINKTLTGAVSSFGVANSGGVQSDVTTAAYYYRSTSSTAASSFTLSNLYHFHSTQGTIGASSTVTNQYGFTAESTLTGASNNYGFYSNIAAATNRWNFFSNGTANNAFNGNVRIGSTVAPTVALDVTGAVLATTSIRSSGQTAGVGYATGAGSTVTQGSGSGKATSVTLNRVCGQITMDSATLNAATAVSFTLNNTAIATTDVVIVNIDSGATTNSYSVTVEAVGANSCQIQLYNHSASNLSEAVALNFAVIKSVTA